MFLIYAPPGATLPLLTLWLKELSFTPFEMGWVCAAQPIGSLVASLVAGQIADRWLAAERCVSICAFVSGILLWLLAGLSSFPDVLAVSLAYWIVFVPVLTLGTSLSFAQLSVPENDFGRIRLWGTIGWVASVWLMSFWFEQADWVYAHLAWPRSEPGGVLSDIFRLAAILSFILAVYALTLPHTPPTLQAGAWLAPLAAVQLLRLWPFAVYTLVTLGLCVTIPFTGQVTPLLLQHLGIPLPWLSRSLTIAQSTEIVALGLLPMLLLRLGTRGTMRLGLAAWTLALILLMIGQPLSLVLGSMTLNGLCICCYLVAGQVFINRLAHGDIRASAQGLFSFTNGVGLLVGNLLVGAVRSLVNFPPAIGVIRDSGEGMAACGTGMSLVPATLLEGAGNALTMESFPPTFGVAVGIALVLCAVFFMGFRGAASMQVSGKEGKEMDAGKNGSGDPAA
jgi:hypothetical protein